MPRKAPVETRFTPAQASALLERARRGATADDPQLAAMEEVALDRLAHRLALALSKIPAERRRNISAPNRPYARTPLPPN
jgi:hypothetical protein